MKLVHEESLQSLFLTPMARQERLGSATGFIVSVSGLNYLVTNWHVLAGRHAHTAKPLSDSAATPDAVEIVHNGQGNGTNVVVREPLYAPDDPDDLDAEPLWTGHPRAPLVDVAVLPLSEPGHGVRTLPYRLSNASQPDVAIEVTSELAVVGYPLGLRHEGKLAIWTRGTVATEYEVDYDGLPCFLIDARTRNGQSGSPVLYFQPDGRAARFRDTETTAGPGAFSRLLGVYSGRVHDESDIGYVWRTEAIVETIEAAIAGVRGPVDFEPGKPTMRRG